MTVTVRFEVRPQIGTSDGLSIAHFAVVRQALENVGFPRGTRWISISISPPIAYEETGLSAAANM